ncbi:MAG: hypothetical protein CEE38_10510 [Planctomycetes bacterium B3_Pla]|nr:MAG: hypothetical protein CEE38_10510 [Planctomycetes bacterium B3_Pla]
MFLHSSVATEATENAEKGGFVSDLAFRASDFRPQAGYWLCFFKLLFAVRSTQYAIRDNWLCFFKFDSQHAIRSTQNDKIGFVFSIPINRGDRRER